MAMPTAYATLSQKGICTANQIPGGPVRDSLAYVDYILAAPMSTSSSENQTGPLRAAIMAVQLPDTDDEAFAASVAELDRLGRTLGVEVVTTVTQRRPSLHAATVIGTGKLAELVALAGGGDTAAPIGAGINAVLVDHDITPSQARNLEKATGVEVLDRTAVILEIFRRHARSRAAKAQVEIVRLQYLVPRLREQGREKGGDRQRGGIGGKGAGESNLELDRRKIRDRIAELTRDLVSLAEEQRTQRARRRDMSRVALVGYTNAGKSTLMRALTSSEVYVADKLFATLDTTVRPLVPETRPRVLVSDTVGFIDKLPHGLVASFKSTLDEAMEASLLAYVVDASAPTFERQLAVTTEVLGDIGAADVPRLLVFNKIDACGDAEAQARTTDALLARWPEALVMSARRPGDVARLREALVAFFNRDLVEGEICVPYDRQQLRGEIFAGCEVLGERSEESGVIFRVRAHPALLERLQAA
jgi:GTPase